MWFLFLFQLLAWQSSPFPDFLPLNLHLSNTGGWNSQQTRSLTLFAFFWKSPVILCSINKVFNLFRFDQFTKSFLLLCCCIQDSLYENIKLHPSNWTCCWDWTDSVPALLQSLWRRSRASENSGHHWTSLDQWAGNLGHCTGETTNRSSGFLLA